MIKGNEKNGKDLVVSEIISVIFFPIWLSLCDHLVFYEVNIG